MVLWSIRCIANRHRIPPTKSACVRYWPPTNKGSPTTFVYLAICTTCACHLVIFISDESLFADAIKLSVVQTAIFHLYIIWYCDETTITIIVFLKVGQVSESSECKAKPHRTRKLTSLLVIGRFCEFCTGRIWVAFLSRAAIRPFFGVHVHFFHEKWNNIWGHSKISKHHLFTSFILHS